MHLRPRLKALSLLLLLALLAACAAPAATGQPPAEATPLPPRDTTLPATPTPPAEPAAPTETAAAQSTEIVLTDAAGRTVRLDGPPQRIVLAGRAVALIADAVYFFPAALERVVAVSGTSQGSAGDFLDTVDPAFASKIAFDTNVGAEQVITARPDLVIMKTYMAETLGTPLTALGVPVFYVDLETPEQYQRELLALGQIFQDEARAQEVAGFYRERVENVTTALAGLSAEERPRVLLLYYSNRDGQAAFNVPPKTWIQTIITELAGGQPAWLDIELGSGWTKVNLEQVAAWDADQIFIIHYTGDPVEVVQQLYTDPQWSQMRAVKDGNLHAFPKDYYSWDQPDSRWILGLNWLAWKLHPQRFAGYDPLVDMQGFFERFYGIEPALFEQVIQPRIRGLE